MYAQDAWHLGRLTLTGALRWEYISEQASGEPAQRGRFAHIPAYSDIHPPTWKDFSPRLASLERIEQGRQLACPYRIFRTC